jgi:hypothetical protein
MENQKWTSPPDSFISGGDVRDISEWSFSWHTSLLYFLEIVPYERGKFFYGETPFLYKIWAI